MLIGEFEHSLDAKGRLIMPAKLRESIGENFVVTKGLDGCLFAFSITEWTNFEEKLKSLPLSNRNSREFTRFFLSGATECEIDKQGRFLIPNNLREAAGLIKEVVIIGVGSIISNQFPDEVNNYIEENLNIPANSSNSITVNTINKTTVSADSKLQIYYFDVGQADSSLIIADGKTMLIDAGNNEDGPLLVQYIQALGISRIDYLVGTHPHEDHIGGLDDIINNFEIWDKEKWNHYNSDENISVEDIAENMTMLGI